MKVKLSDITKYSKGVQINGDDLIDDGEYIYLNGGINPSGRWSSSNVSGDTVTISEGGNSSGYVNYITEPFWCGAHCYYLYEGPSNSKYLYYALKSQQNRLFAIRSGACMPNIKKSDLGNFELEFDYNERKQDEVVAVLSGVELVIARRQKELELIDELIKARFVEMFGNPESDEKFPQVAVKDFTDVVSGGTPDRKNNEYWENGTVPWVKTTELQNNKIDDVEEFITEKGLLESSAKIVPKDTVLIAMYGQGKTRGMTAILGIPASTNQACACLLPSEYIEPKYLWQYIIMSYDRLRNLAQGGNQPNLNGNMIKNFTVLIPPKELQVQFVHFVEQVNKSKFIIHKALDETQTLFDSLMQEYFG
ncbi:MAG: hypothetical protein E7197_05385 [Anaerovibrio sp.]|uniref:restriction endonuclease subunit S n=1 Tax=Anaerovibrio sp. TaxID=1872532 RepID=UPI0025C70AEC|nr:restriction endonuclease subunit S [Anaerovibrio sp.]MBE6099470.1 hypothetical protein [Anaerovibrio sp.]